MKKYERRYKSELEAVIAMAQKELGLLEADCMFTPSDALLTALREAREAGIRLEVSIKIGEDNE